MTELNAVPWDIPARENPIESSVETEAPAKADKPKPRQRTTYAPKSRLLSKQKPLSVLITKIRMVTSSS